MPRQMPSTGLSAATAALISSSSKRIALFVNSIGFGMNFALTEESRVEIGAARENELRREPRGVR